MKNHQLLSGIEVLRYRYRHFSKKKKGEVLDELTMRFSVDRKYLVRLLARKNGGRPKTPLKSGRPSQYGDASFQSALRKVWKITYFMCGRYLKIAMPDWLPSIEERYGAFTPDIHDRLLKISAATIDRLLRPQKGVHGKCFTRPGSIIRSEIPLQGPAWDISIPGYIECDTVAHCGGSMLGDFINSVTTVDIASTWTEVRGTWGRGSSGVYCITPTETLRKLANVLLPIRILAGPRSEEETMSEKKKRRNWTASEKLRIVLAGLDGTVEVSELCRREGINPTQYYGWKKQLLGSAAEVIDAASVKPSAKEQRLEADLRRAKDVIAEITAENLDLKKGLSG